MKRASAHLFEPEPPRVTSRFLLLNPGQLHAHPVKGSKKQDIDRILTSEASEDYVTWNMIQLLQAIDSRRWWPDMVQLARTSNPDLDVTSDLDDLPRMDLWRKCATPPGYEGSCRVRMSASDNPDWRARSTNPKPVEGATEVDIAMEGRDYLILVEAKLGSDISPATKYDPVRNQIVRNIDVLLESAAGRSTAFWMIVRDTGRERAYVQLITEYRSNPGSLAALLPHRTAAEIDSVTRNLAIIHWSDVLALIEREYGAVFGELRRQVVA